jgi:hypothetical protein
MTINFLLLLIEPLFTPYVGGALNFIKSLKYKTLVTKTVPVPKFLGWLLVQRKICHALP